DLDLLRTSLAEIVRRHGALRTLIVDCDGTPMQEISGHVDSDIEFHDLKSVPERSREVEVERHIEQFVQKPVDIAVGPLFGVCLLRTADDEHVLIAAMEHLISDGTSLNIFVRDLLVAYAQLWKGGPVSLPPLSMQFADYAVWQRKSEKLWLDRFHFWKGQFADFRRTRFPQDGSSQTSPSGWATASFRIDAEKRIELLEWSQKMNTTVVLAVFTAYVALVLRWCSVTRSVIQFQFNGRTSKKLENTIGFFASPLHLDVILREEDTFTDLLIRVTDEYCRAHERADSFYLATQVPRPEVTANTVFNWSPLGASIEISGTDGAQGPLACSPIRIPDDPVCKKLAHDHEPVTRFCDAGDEILGSVFFPLHRFSTALIERFTGNLLMFVSALMRQPNQRVNNIKLL
ncbi:MAG TPA: condensation domain-containing protein, partial [Paraburkholderia sp.]|uniref:condensation domain-containing protein n=1 Tax=Paraburkholderia sp. TaxID=1926495 RepID=UPI002B4855C5